MAVISGIDFRTILSIFHEGVIVADAGGTILYYNDTQGRIDDLPPGEAIGKKIIEVYDLTEAQSTTMRCLHTGRPIPNQPIFYRTRLGRFANVVSNVYPIHAAGRLVGAISFTKDYQMVEKIVSPSSRKKPEASGNGTRYAFGDIVGSSPGLRKAVETARMASASPSAVMIFGETGTGKEIIAQSIHNHGPTRPRSFIPINCAAIPENLLEAILFGTTRGAFTGAVDRPGLFEEAASGTLFLDEINAMPLSLQAKLLRVVQEKRIRRIGSPSETPVDVKLVSSLNEDPYRAISRRNPTEGPLLPSGGGRHRHAAPSGAPGRPVGPGMPFHRPVQPGPEKVGRGGLRQRDAPVPGLSMARQRPGTGPCDRRRDERHRRRGKRD